MQSRGTLQGVGLALFASAGMAFVTAYGVQAKGSDVKMRTVKVDKAAAERGKTAFAVCAACHGAEGIGIIGLGPALASKSFLAAASDAYLIDTIKNGRTGTTMIPWGTTLKDPQINDIVAYIRSISKTEPAKLDNSPVKGQVANGERLYQDICASCHGVNGTGYAETQNGTAIGNAAFLKIAGDGFLRHLIRYGKSGTMMRGFDEKNVTAIANLTAQEIEDVIAYLRANAK